MSSRGIKRYVEQVLEAEGVAAYAIRQTRGNHQELRFDHRGCLLRVIFPNTPSDHRSFENTRSTIRRLMRAAERVAIPATFVQGPVLDAGRLLPRKPHDVGKSRARPRSYAAEVLNAYLVEHEAAICFNPNS